MESHQSTSIHSQFDNFTIDNTEDITPHPLPNGTPYLDTCNLTKYVYWVMRSLLPLVLTWHPTTKYYETKTIYIYIYYSALTPYNNYMGIQIYFKIKIY